MREDIQYDDSGAEDDYFDADSSDEHEEEAEPVDERETWRVPGTAYTSSSPTLFVVDYAPGLMFSDKTEQTCSRLVLAAARAGAEMRVARLSLDEYEGGGWESKLGRLHMFPAYVLVCEHGVYHVAGDFERRSHIVTQLVDQ